MKYLTYTLWALFLTVSIAFSRPANPDLIVKKQSDGSTLVIKEHGDEHYHYTTTEDDLLIVKDSSGFYVYADSNGAPSKIKAKNKEHRISKDNQFLNRMDQKKVKEKHKAKRSSSYPNQNRVLKNKHQKNVPKLLKRPTASSMSTGERYFPVLLVSTLDQPRGDSLLYHRFLNEPGFSEQGNIGSLRDYFLISSDSLFNPHFDVFPIQINKRLGDYVSGLDFLEGQFTKEAIDILVQHPAFSGSRYCSNGSYVDGFFFLFPGTEENALKIHESFWGHQYWMQWNGSTRNNRPYLAGGVNFNAYAFLAQKEDRAEYNINQMGIFAHEFSHVLGLSDLYGEDANGNFVSGPTPWDIMTQGMYNDKGRKPPKYSAFERESMGWLTLTELSSEENINTLFSLDQLQAYSVTNPQKNDEYYIIEYRPQQGYDSGIRNIGVLVWYIDYNQEIWKTNNPNKDPNHQRVAMKDVLYGTLSSKTSYSPFTFVDNSSSAIPGVYSFVKGTAGEDRVCFSTHTTIKGFVCEDNPSSSSFFVESSSSSVTEWIGNSMVHSNYKISVIGRDLSVYLPQFGEKVIKIMDVQGNLLYTDRFYEEYETISLQNKGVYYIQIFLNHQLLTSSPLRIR